VTLKEVNTQIWKEFKQASY